MILPTLSVVEDLCMLGLCYASHWQARQAKRSPRSWLVLAAVTLGFLLADLSRLLAALT